MDGSEDRPKTTGGSANHSAEELLPLVYEELRRLASGELARERPGQTLQPTALVHEAWLRLTKSKTLAWEGRTHFFAASANAIRRILVENARRKQRIKRGGGCERVDADPLDLPGPVPEEDLLALDEALTQLAELDPEAAELVNLRFFTGLTQAEAAEQLGISRSNADRSWVFARAWLYQRVRLPDPPVAKAPSTRPIS